MHLEVFYLTVTDAFLPGNHPDAMISRMVLSSGSRLRELLALSGLEALEDKVKVWVRDMSDAGWVFDPSPEALAALPPDLAHRLSQLRVTQADHELARERAAVWAKAHADAKAAKQAVRTAKRLRKHAEWEDAQRAKAEREEREAAAHEAWRARNEAINARYSTKQQEQTLH